MVANDIDGRTLCSVFLVLCLAVTAGCSAPSGPSGTATTDATPTTAAADGAGTPTPTASPTPPATTAETATATDDDTTSMDGGATSGGGEAEDGHSHGGDESDDGHTHDDGESGTAAANATSGRIAVVVDGERLVVQERAEHDDGTFWVDENRSDVWHSAAMADGEAVTMAEALSAAGVDATASTLSAGDTTYREETAGTKLVYRADGEEVDPTEYTLAPGDEVWVLVLTDGTNASVPGEYIPPDRLHVHGSMEMTVEGESLNFSRPKYQAASHNSHFHFEGGHADPWHAHSWSVTLAYALSTLEGIEVTDEALTYQNTTYAYDDAGTTVRFTVNGEAVEPTDYFLKDGDAVEVVVESA